MNSISENTHSEGSGFRLAELILPIYLPSAIMFLGAGMVMPILALFARHLGATVAEASIIVGIFGFGNLIFNVPSGVFINRFGNRIVILTSTLTEAFLALLLGFAGNKWSLAALVLLLGMVHTSFFVSRLALLRNLVPSDSRGRALAIIGGENRLGQFIGPIAGGLVAQNWGFRYALWAFSALMFLSFFLLYAWVPREKRETETERTKRIGSGHSAGRILRILSENRRVFSTAGVAVIVLQLLRTGRQAIVPLAAEALGLSVSRIGFVVGIMFFTELLLFYPAGMIMDRFGRKIVAVPCLLLFALGILLVPMAGSFGSIVFFVIVAGMGNGIGSGLNMTLSTDFAPSDNPAEFIGVWRFIVDLGTSGGPFLVSLFAGIFSLGMAAVVIGVLGFSGAAVMAWLVPETLKKPDPG